MGSAEILPFAYPNEGVTWSLMIVLYPYITGLVDGALILAALYHVFGHKELRPVSRLSTILAFSFLSFATVPLLMHLGHPERAFNIMITPNMRSAMAGFGFIYLFAFACLTVEVWLEFRPEFVRRANLYRGSLLGTIYKVVSLGVDDVSPEAMAIDHRVGKILSAIEVPTACLLQGYVGFLFGSAKANPWWSSALIPLIFILSAIVSGIALVTIFYLLWTRLRREEADPDCLRTLMKYLWGFLIVAVAIEGLELLSHAYESTEDWAILSELIATRIGYSFVGVQFLIGSLLPMVMMGWVILSRRRGQLTELVAYLSSVILLLQVLAMRWNVIVGGQLFSKSLRGFVSFHFDWLDREGPLAAAGILVLALTLFAVLARILPLRERAAHRA